MGVVFISYRRHDSAGHAGALFDHLATVYPPEQVFIDTNEPRVGEKWPARLELALEGSLVVLCIIGLKWDASRLRRDGDFVRQELRAALTKNRPIVPLLFDGASLPRPEDLPEDCRGILDHLAMAFDPWDRELYKAKIQGLPKAIDRLITKLYEAGDQGARCCIVLDSPLHGYAFGIGIDGGDITWLNSSDNVPVAVGWHTVVVMYRYYRVERTGGAGWHWDRLHEGRVFLSSGNYYVAIREKRWPWPLGFIGKYEASQPLRK
jgi:hypothetical protein